MQPELSIVIPTCARADSLARCLESIRVGTQCDHEIIVVNGASGDHTANILQHAKAYVGSRLHVIDEPKREGFVRAANKGFRAARGTYLTWLNDDARLVPGSLDRALDQLRSAPPTLGMVAMFHAAHTSRNIAFQTTYGGKPFSVLHVRGTLYANFGIARREVFERLGYFDERFYFYAADPDLSLKVWNAGLEVVPALGSLIDHDEVQDARRSDDAERGRADNAKLFQKWNLPSANPQFNDFDPTHPCTLKGRKVVQQSRGTVSRGSAGWHPAASGLGELASSSTDTNPFIS